MLSVLSSILFTGNDETVEEGKKNPSFTFYLYTSFSDKLYPYISSIIDNTFTRHHLLPIDVIKHNVIYIYV